MFVDFRKLFADFRKFSLIFVDFRKLFVHFRKCFVDVVRNAPLASGKPMGRLPLSRDSL